jgi:hypothetical protein
MLMLRRNIPNCGSVVMENSLDRPSSPIRHTDNFHLVCDIRQTPLFSLFSTTLSEAVLDRSCLRRPL